jgi:hypothetical protein
MEGFPTLHYREVHPRLVIQLIQVGLFVSYPLIYQVPVMKGPMDDEQMTEKAVLAEDKTDIVLWG